MAKSTKDQRHQPTTDRPYGWGFDGLGRAFLCRNDEKSNQIIFCMLPGFGGLEGVFILEDQGQTDAANAIQEPTP